MTVTDWFCQNYITRNHEKYCCYVLTKTLASVYLRKEVEILGTNTDNKFSYNSCTKTSVDNLVRYSLVSLE